MTLKIQHKRSAVKAKAPQPTDLEYGEIAVNYEASDPCIYIKDSANTIRRIGHQPGALVFQGSVAPTSVAPTSPQKGDVYVMSAAGVMAASWTGMAGKTVVQNENIVWDGTKWETLGATSNAAATETVAGIVELATAAETTTGTDATRAVHPAGLKVELDKKATKTVTSDTAPANPKDGDLWYDSVGGELYVWYDSDDAGAVAGTWVQANPQPTKYSTITLGTAVTASTTAVDFTGIPAGVKRITVMFSGVSTNGTSVVLVQLGDSGGIEATGYSGSASINTSMTITAEYTAGFGISQQSNATDLQSGHILLTNLDSNTWVASVSCARANATSQGAGTKTLSGTLDRVRITTVNGTDTFDAGSINISYEF